MKTKMYSSKEEFEKAHPYVIVQFEVVNGETIATIEKAFTYKRDADRYLERHGNRGQEVMTRNKFYREALMCM